MKNVINYFYNFNIDNLRMIDDNYYFTYQNKQFVFQEIKDVNFDYQAILELNRILIANNKTFFKIILNKNNDIITYNSNKKYILMIDNCSSDRIFNFFDVMDSNIKINENNKIISVLNKSNWIDLWQKKIDYFEMYVDHNINKCLIINKYANYFIGLGENAILYVKNTIDEERPSIHDNLVTCHKRLLKDESLKQLYNPTYLIVDYRSRDIAEYLKMLFFKGTNNINDVTKYLEYINLSNYSARMVISRMLFPSFFFDSFEKLIEGKLTEQKILHIIEKMNYYEQYVLDIYMILRNRYDIPEIKWLKKVDYSSTFITPRTSGTSFINIDSIPSLSVTSIMLQ